MENNENMHRILDEFHGSEHLAKRMHPKNQKQNKIIYSRSAHA